MHRRRIRVSNHILLSPVFLAIALVLAIAGTAVVVRTWRVSLRSTADEAMRLAMAAEVGFQRAPLSMLRAESSDLQLSEYWDIKHSLEDLVAQKNEIRFAYIYIQRDGKIYMLVDSESPESPDFSPPGQEYWEATEETWRPFQTGEALLTRPSTDRWGTWVSALVPMKDAGSGEVIAVFGIDYPAASWNDHAISHTVQMALFMLAVFTVFVVVWVAFAQNRDLKAEQRKLLQIDAQRRENEALFRSIFDQSPIGIAIGHQGNYLSLLGDDRPGINPMFQQILGRTEAELAAVGWASITHPDDLPGDLERFAQLTSGEIDGYDLEKRYLRPDGAEVWTHLRVVPLRLGEGAEQRHLCLVEDISKRKAMEKALLDSERSKSVLLDNLLGMAYRCNYDRAWTMQFVSAGCLDLTGYPAESLLYNRDLTFSDLIAPEYREILWQEWERVLPLGLPFRREYEIICATGERKWVLEMGQGVYDDAGQVEALEGIVFDISKQKEREERIRYINEHDYLTDLHNRRYFEEAMSRIEQDCALPFSLIVVDIDGVRLINSAFGYDAGDNLIKETAQVLRGCCRPGDLLARLGGDEFVLLLPDTDNCVALERVDEISAACARFNEQKHAGVHEISVSIGFATRTNRAEAHEATLRAAEDLLRNRKLFNSRSSHSDIISSMMAAVYEKSQETEEHSKRLAALATRIGSKLGLSQTSLSELELLATLHDIGKVAIDDHVLNKPGKLSEEEWAIMKTHSEIGYRIAKSSFQLEPIAQYILTHHERWDGKGYPLGLQGEDIPLISRIIAVADAYDAMTEDRVYRKALTREQALAEIERNSGTQFDPTIVRILIDHRITE